MHGKNLVHIASIKKTLFRLATLIKSSACFELNGEKVFRTGRLFYFRDKEERVRSESCVWWLHI